MNVEKMSYLGYEIDLIYRPFWDESVQRSKQYRVVVKKDGKELLNRYGLTNSGAIAYAKQWINSHSK